MAPKARSARSKSAPKAGGKSKAKAKSAASTSSRSASTSNRRKASNEVAVATPRSGTMESVKSVKSATGEDPASESSPESVPTAAARAQMWWSYQRGGQGADEADPQPNLTASSSSSVVPVILPVQVTTPSAKREQLELNVVDPWADLSNEEAYARVVHEAWDNSVEGFQVSLVTGPAHVIAKDGCKLCNREAWPAIAISLDISETSLERVDSLPALWLRNIDLGGNPLQSFEGISELFPRLLCVDLSFVDLSSVTGAWDDLALCRNLRAISAEGANVTSFEVMHRMESLESLELLENGVEELDEIETLAARCPSLAKLDLRENPVAYEPGYLQRIKEHLPLLMWHDNQSRKQYVAKTIDQCGYGNLSAEVNAVDGLYKNEHCSCLEGNPCIEKETCVDWENREAVAAETRKRKGLRDETGKQL